MQAFLSRIRPCLSRALRHWCLGAALAGLSGCGAIASSTNQRVRSVPADECPGATVQKTTATDAILLEWDGGTTRIYPGDFLPGLDLGLFIVTDGETLADEADAFKDAVRDEVSRILCEMPTDGIHLTNNKGGLPRDITTVYLSQSRSLIGGSQIGQGEYDPCNEMHDNDAIIFGGQILELGDERTFDDWVLVFANVTAHEIGHMLGYGHVPRVIHPASQRPAHVELMLATHTVDEMVQSQRLLHDTTNCPEEIDPATARERGTFSCGHE